MKSYRPQHGSSSHPSLSFSQRKSEQEVPKSPSHSRSGTRGQDANHYKFKVGDKLNDVYTIKRLLGDGTFGRVVECEYRHKRYAIKVLSARMQIIRPVARYIESAKTEKSILKEINRRDKEDRHGLVRYLHSFEHDGHFCMVFRPLGKSLYDAIRRNNGQGFPLKLIQSFFRQVLESLEFLHRIGYTHTDLKPENILLQTSKIRRKHVDPQSLFGYSSQTTSSCNAFSQMASSTGVPASIYSPADESTQDQTALYLPKRNHVRIIDFGGATRFDQNRHSLVCTRQYRPPEVILNCCEWNELVDVWSVGCIVSELWTGRLLFETHSDQEHLAMIEKNSGPFPKWMINKTPSSLQRLFLDGSVDPQELDRHLQSWYNIDSMRTTDSIFSEHEELQDLLSKCLVTDPNRRISCATALRHPFFSVHYS